jgi:hypothetical protein
VDVPRICNRRRVTVIAELLTKRVRVHDARRITPRSPIFERARDVTLERYSVPIDGDISAEARLAALILACPESNDVLLQSFPDDAFIAEGELVTYAGWLPA